MKILSKAYINLGRERERENGTRRHNNGSERAREAVEKGIV
jgi:hypothetical protein